MQLLLREFREEPKTLNFSSKDGWLNAIVKSCDEVETNESNAREIACSVTFQKRNELFVVKGEVKTTFYLACSKCAEDVPFKVDVPFRMIFSKDKNVLENTDRDSIDSYTDISVEEAEDIVYLDGNVIDVAEIVNDHVISAIPFQPLCDKKCKGLCLTCGKNLNIETCEHIKN